MDMVTMNIVDSAMVAICREMGVNVQKTAYSTIFSEAEDFTCALASPEGDMISVAEFCPAQIGGVPLLVRSMVKEIAKIEPGDVIVHHSRLIHGSGPNYTTNVPRRAASLRYAGDDVTYFFQRSAPPQPHHQHSLKDGDVIDCEQFPVVWRAA